MEQEKRLIDANALVSDMMSTGSPTQFGRSTAKMCVKRAPTIDAVPIVRCKDCRKSTIAVLKLYMCGHWGHFTEANNYCGYGECAKMDADAPERAGKDGMDG